MFWRLVGCFGGLPDVLEACRMFVLKKIFQDLSLNSLFFGQGHCLLEMPSGTGKTMSLLSLIVAYINSKFVCIIHIFINHQNKTKNLSRDCPLVGRSGIYFSTFILGLEINKKMVLIKNLD